MGFSEEIKKARLKMRIDKPPSVPELAIILGVSASYLYALEAGDHGSASLSFLKKYSKETGVPIQKFIDKIEN
jgi:transcriptional regulator with XRE-family HTH domain